MELSATIGFPAVITLFLCTYLTFYRKYSISYRIILYCGTVYFLFRTWWEGQITREIPLESVSIRIDLLILSPLDFAILGVCLALLLSPFLKSNGKND